MAPANDIARQLVADGVPDAPMQVYTLGLKGCLVWCSFQKAVGYTFKENAQTAVKRVRWEAPEDAAQRYRAGPKQGVKAPAGTPKVLRKHVAPQTLDEIGAELIEIRGDKDFRDTIERLVHALRMTSGSSIRSDP